MNPLTAEEKAEVVTNCDHLAKLKYSPTQKRNAPLVLRRGKEMMAALLAYADIVQSPYISSQVQRRFAHVSS